MHDTQTYRETCRALMLMEKDSCYGKRQKSLKVCHFGPQLTCTTVEKNWLNKNESSSCSSSSSHKQNGQRCCKFICMHD